MSTTRITCSCGYSWDHPEDATTPANARDACPVCNPDRQSDASQESNNPRTVVRSTGECPPIQAPLASPAWVPAGYGMLEELNRGGMGVIYKARHFPLGRDVALKVISPAALSVQNVRERFEREVLASARLNHPNIVTIFDTDLRGPIPFLAMEYIPGIDLLRLVHKAGPLPIREALGYARQAAEGLRHLHEQGLVHRDIKPSNLMIAPSPIGPRSGGEAGQMPQLKILDMGLTRPAPSDSPESSEGLTKEGVFLGTPDYVAPEQAEDSRSADARSDIYSLGSCLYFLLTGEAPYPGVSLLEKVRKVATEPTPSPRAKRKDVPPELDQLVRRMLAPRPGERFQSAREAIAALDRIASAPFPSSPPAPIQPAETSVMASCYFDRERSAVVRLAEAVKDRATAEADLASVFQLASEKAERDMNRARKANTAARETELSALDSAHDRATREQATRFDAEMLGINRAREEKRAAVVQKYKAAEERGKGEYKDRIWQLDSILEGGEKKARDQMELLQRKAAAGKEQVEQLWQQAEEPLARCKVAVDFTSDTPPLSDDDPINGMQKAIAAGEEALDRLKHLFWPKFSRFGGLLACIVLMAGVGASSLAFMERIPAIATLAGTGLILGIALWFAIKVIARKHTVRSAKQLGERLALAEASCDRLHRFAENEYEEEHERINDRHRRKRKETETYYLPLFAAQKKQYEDGLDRIVQEHEAAAAQANRKNAEESKAESDGYHSRRNAALARLDAELQAAESSFNAKMTTATQERDEAWDRLAEDWHATTTQARDEFQDLRQASERLFPEWDGLGGNLATKAPAGIRLGDMSLELGEMPDGIPTDERLAPPADLSGLVPLFAPFPDRCSVVFRTRDEGRAAGVAALQAAMLRFLTGLPPGKVRFTIIDPVGLGDNFAAFMHLADFDDKLISGQIWTEPRQIEARLADLTDHIASVIQKYLRNQYKTIEDYNRAAGEVAEAYRVLVIANFPTNFTPEAAKRLVSIVNSGPSCGVCTLVSVDTKLVMPRDFAMADLESPSLTLSWSSKSSAPGPSEPPSVETDEAPRGSMRPDGRFVLKDPALAPLALSLDQPPEPAVIARIVQQIGQASKDAVRVEVPFDYIAPKANEIWTSSAARGFDVPVGRAGATRRQVFSLGRGTAQHALIAGKTGSGKSTLLHALITNLAMMYSPDEAELYLVDLKEGVEFQWYATYRLPHARVVAINSEREFALSVLQRLDGVLRERGEKFREAGCNDLAGYREAAPRLKTPRILLVVDEFQMLFVEDDKLAQEAALLLDRLVRQGRAFGMHVLLGSQTLGGAYSLPRSTIDQMAVRVALQCSDADAQMILAKDNSAARLLSRPGEAIYNDQNGLTEGNDPFQVVWLAEEKREEVLKGLGERAAGDYPPPLVFEGNSAADLARNPALARALEGKVWQKPKVLVAWLGDPVAIKEPTLAPFRAQGAANLLLLGQNEVAARGLFTASLIGLAAQIPPEVSPEGEASSRGQCFTLLDGTPDESEEAEVLRKLASGLPQHAACPDRAAIGPALAALALEIERRQKGDADRSPRFLFIFGVQRFRELRKAEDDFGIGRRGAEREQTPAERFATILKEGPAYGIHAIVWCDSLTNLNRAFDRPLLREFAMRVFFPMSQADSSTLMDSPAASKLGPNRALLLLEEKERPEKFRPYGLPSPAWLEAVQKQLRERTDQPAE